MAVVQNIKEKVHLPIYDCINVEPGKQLRSIESSSTLKFFTNVQGKTKLETNLQSASLLPHYNTFEARALRVVISDLPPDFVPEKEKEEPRVDNGDDNPLDVVDDDGDSLDRAGAKNPANEADIVTADIDLTLTRAVELLKRADGSDDRSVDLDADDDDVTLSDEANGELDDAAVAIVAGAGGVVTLTVDDLKEFIEDLDKQAPAPQQLIPNNGAGTLIGNLVYNTVTSLYVGEKLMIEMPTWFFPAGAGPYSEAGKFTTHGEPSPTATFRFAEPIFIDKQQNFRVEIEVPDSTTLKDIQKIYGPFFIWVVLDGYMTRDVQ
jgi:hypothetical protein